jgi:2-oxoglutarate ferredoxin oxidoreductase subunit alpha
MGPSTGLPTRVSQGDLRLAYYLGHGDAKHVCLLPGSVKECFEYGWRAFDLAERLQTPVFVLSDLDLGMNQWMSEPFEYPDTEMDRGKVLTADDLDRLGSFGRYKDVDGDGIGYRTLPGNEHPLAAYFTRGTGHNERAQYSERPDDWEHNMERLKRKFATARGLVPRPVVDSVDGAEVGLIGFGSTDLGITEARARLAAQGLKTSYLRVRALPLTEDVATFVAAHKRVYVIEMNTDQQLCQLVRLNVVDHLGDADRVQPCNHNDGLPLTARWITEAVLGLEAKKEK